MSSNQVRVRFDLNPKDGHGYETERLWAERRGHNNFRIMNSPFFAFGISPDDIVKAKGEGDEYQFQEVVKRGGHSTYRIFLQGNRTVRDSQFEEYWSELANLGCACENANDRLIAVDVPPGVDVAKVYRVLEKGEAEGIWAFEEAHYAGAITQ